MSALMTRFFQGQSALALCCLFGVLGSFSVLAGCTSTGGLTPMAQVNITTTLNEVCPVLAAAQPMIAGAGKKVRDAATILALACPPNPPPTNAIVAAEDLLAAYQVLSSYLHKS